jgi:hypothetical protein
MLKLRNFNKDIACLSFWVLIVILLYLRCLLFWALILLFDIFLLLIYLYGSSSQRSPDITLPIAVRI